MRPVVVTTSGVSKSTPVVVDYINTAFSVGFACVVSGSATYTVQHSFDDPFASYATDYNTNATWFDHDIINLVGATTSQNGSFSAPIRATRVNQTAGAGGVTMTVVQGMK